VIGGRDPFSQSLGAGRGFFLFLRPALKRYNVEALKRLRRHRRDCQRFDGLTI
jgi:hypothetical protein